MCLTFLLTTVVARDGAICSGVTDFYLGLIKYGADSLIR
jgi:hypothetical protein